MSAGGVAIDKAMSFTSGAEANTIPCTGNKSARRRVWLRIIAHSRQELGRFCAMRSRHVSKSLNYFTNFDALYDQNDSFRNALTGIGINMPSAASDQRTAER
jgi:hypothetical protein